MNRKEQRDLHDNQGLSAPSCDQIIGEKFLDGRPSVMAFARVALFDWTPRTLMKRELLIMRLRRPEGAKRR